MQKRQNLINIYKENEIKKLHLANALVAKTLDEVAKHAKPGVSLKELDAIAQDFIHQNGAIPSFKGLYGFKGAICLSLNEVCIHGVPDESILQDGDILGIDIGTKLDGFYGDGARTIGIGKISKMDEDLISCAKDALYGAIDYIHEGLRFKELSKYLEDFICKRGFVPLLGFCGHGIGKSPHCAPEIPNYLEPGVKAKAGPKIKNGMVFCIEPMICQKEGTAVNDATGWNTKSTDNLRTSHYEHCVAVIDGFAQILTKE